MGRSPWMGWHALTLSSSDVSLQGCRPLRPGQPVALREMYPGIVQVPGGGMSLWASYAAEMLAGRLKFGLHEPTLPGDEERVGRQRLYFRVRDLAAHHRRVQAEGAKVGEIVRRSWMDFFSVRDPDGNDIVIAVTDPERHASQPWSRDQER